MCVYVVVLFVCVSFVFMFVLFTCWLRLCIGFKVVVLFVVFDGFMCMRVLLAFSVFLFGCPLCVVRSLYCFGFVVFVTFCCLAMLLISLVCVLWFGCVIYCGICCYLVHSVC